MMSVQFTANVANTKKKTKIKFCGYFEAQ